ncbi:MAG: glycosyltransferase family 2 protein [Elusimicrobia bacterium]|nr:glycosyltransferase family 2 protein [Elusimicrobiota bacterium]
MADLSVIVVNHNSGEMLGRCLSSVALAAEWLDCETIVVDNASSDLDDMPKRFGWARWMRNAENAGWARANNQGARASTAEIIVFLNPDAELRPGSLVALWRFFQNHRSPLGPVGGKLLFSDGGIQPSCGPFPHLGNLLWRLTLSPTLRRYHLLMPERTAPVDWVTGAFMALRRDVWERLGGLDEGFFLYYEDVDLCLRAARLGYRSYYLPVAEAYHHQPHALRKGRDASLGRVIRQSRRRYFEKHRPSWENWVLSGLHKVESL